MFNWKYSSYFFFLLRFTTRQSKANGTKTGLNEVKLLISALIFASGLPSVDKWFFDEVKFRASPELQKLDPNVNLADIYKQVDEWQKTSSLTPKEMTNQKVNEYVQRAKSLIGS